jgi:hypothetical protein
LAFLSEPVAGRPNENLELWAWYGAYDHVALAQLWGSMVALTTRWSTLGTTSLAGAR